jgi:hypothetical protein
MLLAPGSTQLIAPARLSFWGARVVSERYGLPLRSGLWRLIDVWSEAKRARHLRGQEKKLKLMPLYLVVSRR